MNECKCCHCKKEREIEQKRAQEASEKKGVFEERPGKKSAMRVMSFIALFAAIGYTYMILAKDAPTEFGVFIVTGWLIASFAPKAIQKFAEKDIISQ